MLTSAGFYFLFFSGLTCSIWKFQGQGLDPSWSCGLCHSCSSAGPLTHCATVGTPWLLYSNDSTDAHVSGFYAFLVFPTENNFLAIHLY